MFFFVSFDIFSIINDYLVNGHMFSVSFRHYTHVLYPKTCPYGEMYGLTIVVPVIGSVYSGKGFSVSTTGLPVRFSYLAPLSMVLHAPLQFSSTFSSFSCSGLSFSLRGVLGWFFRYSSRATRILSFSFQYLSQTLLTSSYSICATISGSLSPKYSGPAT